MGRQLVPMGMRVGSMAGRKGRLRNGLMLSVRQRIFHGMVTGVFQMAFTVLARPGFDRSFFRTLFFWRCLSGGHTQ
jgi:hypothetical protein